MLFEYISLRTILCRILKDIRNKTLAATV